ncbi:MAG: hypothetical protein ACYTFG_14665, partial [Planctomycetota bacterium]
RGDLEEEVIEAMIDSGLPDAHAAHYLARAGGEKTAARMVELLRRRNAKPGLQGDAGGGSWDTQEYRGLLMATSKSVATRYFLDRYYGAEGGEEKREWLVYARAVSNPDSIQELDAVARTEGDPALRKMAVAALVWAGSDGGEEVGRVLDRLRGEEDPSVRADIVKILGKKMPRPRIAGGPTRLRFARSRAIHAYLPKRSVDDVYNFAKESNSSRLRYRRSYPPPALKKKSPWTKQVFQAIKDAASKDPDPSVRKAGLDVLARIVRNGWRVKNLKLLGLFAKSKLEKAAKEDPSEEVRKYAARLCEEVKD